MEEEKEMEKTTMFEGLEEFVHDAIKANEARWRNRK